MSIQENNAECRSHNRIDFSHTGYDGVKKIILKHDNYMINSMEVHYYKSNGDIECPDKVGCDNGFINEEVCFFLKIISDRINSCLKYIVVHLYM